MSSSTYEDVYGFKYEIVPFRYIYVTNGDEEVFHFLGNLDVKHDQVKEGRAHILIPSWVEMHEIYRLSSRKHPYTKDVVMSIPIFKDMKIKTLLKKIEDGNGSEYLVDRDFVDSLDPNVAIFFIEKIDEVLSKHYYGNSMSQEEQDKLAMDCFLYYKNKNRVKYGERADVPSPPAIVLLLQVCELFHCTPMEARAIKKSDIEAIGLAKEQEAIAAHPELTGIGNKDKHINFNKKKKR